MKPTNVISDAEKVTKALGWINRVRKALSDFRPEIRTLDVNYTTRECELKLAIFVPSGLRKRFLSLKIPAYSNFKIKSILDGATLTELSGIWKRDNDYWKMKARGLPSSESYRITMTGQLSHYAMQKLVYTKSASNRNETTEEEKYWLQAIIKDISLVEKVYSDLRVEDVDVKINIGLEQYYALTLPKDLIKQIRRDRDWIKVGREATNFRDVVSGWKKLQKQRKKQYLSTESLVGWINRISSKNFLKDFFYVDAPYRIGNIIPGQIGKLGLLEQVGVEGLTDLTLKNPIAEGHLTFEKKKYQEQIKCEIDDLQ